MTYPFGSCQDVAARAYQAGIDREPDTPKDEEADAWQRLATAECLEDREKAAAARMLLGVPLHEIEDKLDCLDNQG